MSGIGRWVLAGTAIVGAAAPAAAAVPGEAIRRHATVLASDAFEGRGPGSPGGERAVGYLVQQLERAGVAPLFEGGYTQPVPLVGTRALSSSRLTLSHLGADRALELGAEYLLVTTGAQTVVPRSTPIVFVGYGIVAPEYDYNDYADVDVAGKVVAFLEGEPPSSEETYFSGKQPSVHASVETKQRVALSRGAVGSIVLLDGNASEAQWERLSREYAFEHMTLASTLPRHLSLILHPHLTDELFADALYSAEQVRRMHDTHTMRSFHLRQSLTFEGSFAERSFLSANVGGIVHGTHRGDANTFVVVTAHWDHLGVGPPVDGDAIYNGLVDNALGVAAVLELARELAAAPTRRSVIVLFPTAEERGLLGSVHFLRHAPVPVAQIVAAVNVDGLAHLSRFEDVVAIGGDLSDLGRNVERVARDLGLEASPPPAVWSRHAFLHSDQVAFAEAGVPSVMIQEGFRWPGVSFEEALARSVWWILTRYHSPDDEVGPEVDWPATTAHAGLVAEVVRSIADAAVPPRWRPGVRYGYERAVSQARSRR